MIALLLCLSSGILLGQVQYPDDAKSLLEYHYHTKTQDTLSQQAYVYLSAGAAKELAYVVEKNEYENADDKRFLLQASCWNPDQHATGLAQSKAWLLNNSENQSLAYQQVAGMHDYFAKSVEQSQRVKTASSIFSYILIVFVSMCVIIFWRYV
ncbi:MAG: hypothetical protein H8E25_16275 [Planctomycetes bacterium]|nr:hypothetical protein [Planctomycetota bacterium]